MNKCIKIMIPLMFLNYACNEISKPDYKIKETKIEDKYKDYNSNFLLEEIASKVKNINEEYDAVTERNINSNWRGIVNDQLELITINNSLAVRSIVEKEKSTNEKYSQTRLKALLYNQNSALEYVLDSIKIDPMLQIVMPSDSISVFDYVDSKDKMIEYRIKFLEGANQRETDNGKTYFEPRKILFSVYEWDKDAVKKEGKKSAFLLGSKELELDFLSNDYTIRDLIKSLYK
ncbi:MAG: hypothetical protein QXK76_00230 [Candidatus Woesearchaeota archaeon]